MNQNFNKDEYKMLKRSAKNDWVTVVSVPFQNSLYNGFSYAFAKAVPSADCRMVHVAVSYCSPEDTFKKKVGKYQALSKFYSGETIQLPLGKTNHSSITSILEDMFYI